LIEVKVSVCEHKNLTNTHTQLTGDQMWSPLNEIPYKLICRMHTHMESLKNYIGMNHVIETSSDLDKLLYI
jgi:hypothetical protein